MLIRILTIFIALVSFATNSQAAWPLKYGLIFKDGGPRTVAEETFIKSVLDELSSIGNSLSGFGPAGPSHVKSFVPSELNMMIQVMTLREALADPVIPPFVSLSAINAGVSTHFLPNGKSPVIVMRIVWDQLLMTANIRTFSGSAAQRSIIKSLIAPDLLGATPYLQATLSGEAEYPVTFDLSNLPSESNMAYLSLVDHTRIAQGLLVSQHELTTEGKSNTLQRLYDRYKGLGQNSVKAPINQTKCGVYDPRQNN